MLLILRIFIISCKFLHDRRIIIINYAWFKRWRPNSQFSIFNIFNIFITLRISAMYQFIWRWFWIRRMITSFLARIILYIYWKAFCIFRSWVHLSMHEYRSNSQRVESLSKNSSRFLFIGISRNLLSLGNWIRYLLYFIIKESAFLARALISFLMIFESLISNYEIYTENKRIIKSEIN